VNQNRWVFEDVPTTRTNNELPCPHCNKSVDPLLAPAVSVIEGQIVHFCSTECRELYLNRENPLPAPVTKTTPSDVNEIEKEADTSGTPESMPTTDSQPAIKSTPFRMPALIKQQLVQTIVLTAFLCVPLFVPALYGGWISVAVVGCEAFILAALGVIRERRFGTVRIADAVAVKLAAIALLSCSWFGLAPRLAAGCAAALLLIESIGRLLELFGRSRSGVLEAIEQPTTVSLSSAWKDNSPLAEQIRRVSLAIDWARYPGAALIGLLVFLVHNNSYEEALLSFATALVALGPRTMRMATGDAHLQVALAASSRSVTIRDAHVLDQLAQSRIVLFITKRSLIKQDISVVDWKTFGKMDTNSVMAALGAAEASIKGRFASAICEFVRHQGIQPSTAEDTDNIVRQGIVSSTPIGELACGSRQLMLNRGVATGIGEEHATIIESSGRRVLFVSIDSQLVAAFGIEETPIAGVCDASRKILQMGIEPVMITSAEVEPAQAFGSRLGIENIRFESSEKDTGSLLDNLAQAGESTLLVGSGPAFEEHLASAGASLALGKDEDTQAGIDALNQDIEIVPWVLGRARHARHSAITNLVSAFAAMFLGLTLSISWLSPLTTVFVGCLTFATAAFSTVNSPYPILQQPTKQFVAITNIVRRRLSS
jgi:cation transport ATPase